jgi:Dolichyl-phosphate-mannose-protein mannosyltransferase
LSEVSSRSLNPQKTTDRSVPATHIFHLLSERFTDRLANRLMVALVVYAAVRSLFLAESKPFWYDEVCTVLMARLPSLATIWRALNQAADGNPPVYYLIERAASRLVPNEQIAFRIPSLAGFCCALVCVFLFVRKRSGPKIALVCATLLFLTTLFRTYAAEARPYSLVVGLVAIALLCYQRAPAKPWMFLMGSSLALALTLHYYSIFALVPLILTEAFLVLQTARVRLSVWLALAGSSLPFWAFWPLLAKLREYYGGHFWAYASLSSVFGTYGALFGTAGRMGAAAVAALALGILAAVLLRHELDERIASTLLSEHLVALSFLGLPFVVFVAMHVTHGGMTPKYCLSTVLGISLAMGFVLPRLGWRSVALVSSFIFLGLVFQELTFWTSRHDPSNNGTASAVHVESLIESTGQTDLPVLTSNADDYLATEYYSSVELKKHLCAGVDPAAAVIYGGADTPDRQLLVLRVFAPLKVCDFKAFVSSHAKFLLYSTGGGGPDWWPVMLNREGYSLQVLSADGEQRVYLVSEGNQR